MTQLRTSKLFVVLFLLGALLIVVVPGRMLLGPLLGFSTHSAVPAGDVDIWLVLSVVPIFALVVIRRLPQALRTSQAVSPRPSAAHESAS